MKNASFVVLAVVLTLGVFASCNKEDENGGKSVPEWAIGEWYAPKYPTNPELGLWTTPTAVITASQIDYSGTKLPCTRVGDEEVVFGTDTNIKILKSQNEGEIILESYGDRGKLYAKEAH
ncbi:MAG TPA: hypothetical protein VJ871_01210 [Bacteroidales bacterium]|jgi:hypothetical protein|nr:hypothetical protein [Bacteroidales bacterium]